MLSKYPRWNNRLNSYNKEDDSFLIVFSYTEESGRRGLPLLNMALSGFTAGIRFQLYSPQRSEASLPAVSLTYELLSVPVLRHIDCCLDWRR